MTYRKWVQVSAWPLMICTLIFLVAYAWLIIGTPHILVSIALIVVLIASWLCFVLDYVVRLSLVKQKGRWIRVHWLDLLTIVIPLLRPIQLLKLLSMLGILPRNVETAVRVRIVAYAATSVILMLFVGSLAVLQSERGQPGANIETFGNAMWWSIVTMTTVGYGDMEPVTIIGRIIAVAMMIGGIALIGVVTGTLASWIVSRVAEEDAEQAAETRRELRDIQGKLDRITIELKKRQHPR